MFAFLWLKKSVPSFRNIPVLADRGRGAPSPAVRTDPTPRVPTSSNSP